MGMYPMSMFPTDHPFWELLALCAGTGGSILIIGSAAGVAVMGILHIDFMWYVRRMSIPGRLGLLRRDHHLLAPVARAALRGTGQGHRL